MSSNSLDEVRKRLSIMELVVQGAAEDLTQVDPENLVSEGIVNAYSDLRKAVLKLLKECD